MFTLLSKVVGYLLDKLSTDNTSRGPSVLNSTNKDDKDDLTEPPWLIKPIEIVRSRSLQGKVTHIFHNHGLIDEEVYFSVSDIHEDNPLKVGDSVHCRAVQHREDGGWFAEDITVVTSTWDHQVLHEVKEIDLDILQREVVIGKITLLNKGIGHIDEDIAFVLDECKDGYIPMKGDWVSANVTECEEVNETKDDWSEQTVLRVRKAHNVCPSRHQNVEGTITGVMGDHGYINGEIFFNKAACLNGYQPHKSDTVKVVAIESKQGKCEWRAISIVPVSSESSAYRSKQYQQPIKQTNNTWIIPGQRPQSFAPRVQLPVKLPEYTVPVKIENSVFEGRDLSEVVPQFMQELSFHNYSCRMSALLHLEEIQWKMDIREFDMERVNLRPVGEFLALTVPGLAEGRPSVLIGDKIILSSPLDPGGPCFSGYVHEITATDIHIKFRPDFHSQYSGEDYNVEFIFSRTSFQRCHQAVSLAVQYLGSKVLFPSQVEFKKPQVSTRNLPSIEDDLQQKCDSTTTSNKAQQSGQLHSSPCIYTSQDVRSKKQQLLMQDSASYSQMNKGLSSAAELPSPHQHNGPEENYMNGDASWRGATAGFFNPCLNERQKSAVRNILMGLARPMPYVIFGPPGTGKTITVVEAILQILSKVPSSRIVACTPSNSAADLITERLHASGRVERTQMVRLNAFQRLPDSIPESILKYCRFAEDLPMISRFRLIISTCNMAGHLYKLGLNAGHITHVFVDECGQATEPECLIPVGLISGTDGQIVLAGDPKQLGPVVMSPFAKMYGLELSFLERIMMREPYHRNNEMFPNDAGFDPHLVTMLVDNYRSHPSILELSSRLFYYNQLNPLADPQLTHMLVTWQQLPNPGFPVIFHGIRGEDIREVNSPSWFNPGETVQVIRYLQGVLKEGVHQNDIGVIAPYRKQVEKIRLMMDSLHIPDVKVGSVEEFQGQERKVIIISTVRSNEKLVGFDIRHTLGFLSNPKRFNVSITRAQALLVIVGNPFVLSQDPTWHALIQYCVENKGYTGCDVTDLPKFNNENSSISN